MATLRSMGPLHAPGVSRSARLWIVAAARFGYFAKASVYAVIGLLAMLAAAHTGEKIRGSHGAFMTILSRPYGHFLLAVLCAGLMAYAIWRIMQAVLDCDRRGENPTALAARLGMLFTGFIYAGLSYSALRLLLGLRAAASDDYQARSWTAWLLSQTYGPWLVAGAGGIVIGLAVHEVYVVYRRRFEDRLKTEQMSNRMHKLVLRCAQIGHSARAAVFAAMGLFLLSAAIHSDPGKARGLGGTLLAIEQQRYGDWLLAAVATGFLAYAVYLFLLVFYRRILEP